MTQTLNGILITPFGIVKQIELVLDNYDNETGKYGHMAGETILESGETATAYFTEIFPHDENLALVYQEEDKGCTNWIPNTAASIVENAISTNPTPVDVADAYGLIWGDVVVIGARLEDGVPVYFDASDEDQKRISEIIRTFKVQTFTGI